ncbi:MAG: hypothetical protein WCN27_04470 [Alphaproteobacteria bacterium]
MLTLQIKTKGGDKMRLIILLLISFFSINTCYEATSRVCSEGEASTLVNKFTKKCFNTYFDRVVAAYHLEFSETEGGFYLHLRESDCRYRSITDRDNDGKPVAFFSLGEVEAMRILHDSFVWRYLEEDLYLYLTNPEFQKSGVFHGFPIVKDMISHEALRHFTSINEAYRTLPPPYNEELDLDLTMNSQGFVNLLKLYLEVSSYNGSKISSIAKVIRGLHDFCTAKDEIDVKIKHKEFITLLEESFVVLQDRPYSTYLRQIVGLYKSSTAVLDDLGIAVGFRKELQNSSVASHVNMCRKVGKSGMDALLKRFRMSLFSPYTTDSSVALTVNTTSPSGTTFEDVSSIAEIMGVIASFCSLEDIGRISFSDKYMRNFAREFFKDGKESYEFFADSGVTYPNFQRVFTLGDDRYWYGKLSSASLWLYSYKMYLQLFIPNPLAETAETEAKRTLPNKIDNGLVRNLATVVIRLQAHTPRSAKKQLTVIDPVAEILDERNDCVKEVDDFIAAFEVALLS